MRYVHIAIIVALAAAVLIFAFQNLQVVTVSFFGLRFSAPMALQAVILYLLGMISGGGAVSLVRWAFGTMARVQ